MTLSVCFTRTLVTIGLLGLVALAIPSAGAAEPSAFGCPSFTPQAGGYSTRDRDGSRSAIGLESSTSRRAPWATRFTQGETRLGFGYSDSELLDLQPETDGTLHVRVEWVVTDPFPIDQTDIDLYAYDSEGESIDSSQVYNPFPMTQRTGFPGNWGKGDGGPGWEHLRIPVTRCAGYTLESAFATGMGPTKVRMTVWLDN